MKNEKIQLWTAALRSGEFEQTTGCLSKDGRFCCLGVACEIAIRDGIQIEKTTTSYCDDRTEREVSCYNHEAAYLPPAVVRWLGLEEDQRFETNFDVFETKLVQMNDDWTSFVRIADWIDQLPEEEYESFGSDGDC